MSEFPEYDWVQRSIDMTVSEAEEAKGLSEKLKESGKIGKEYLPLSKYKIKNPVHTIFLELEKLEPEDDMYTLAYLLSEN